MRSTCAGIVIAGTVSSLSQRACARASAMRWRRRCEVCRTYYAVCLSHVCMWMRCAGGCWVNWRSFLDICCKCIYAVAETHNTLLICMNACYPPSLANFYSPASSVSFLHMYNSPLELRPLENEYAFIARTSEPHISSHYSANNFV